MEQLPKIVQARLATAPPSEHPDANLLTAFEENSLTARERSEVLRHLAVCPTCREVVALAVPEQLEATAPAVGASAPRMGRPIPEAPRRGFNLRWGTLAACALIVAGVVLFTRRSEQKTVAMLPQGSISADNVAETRTQEPKPAEMHEHASSLPAASAARKAGPQESRNLVAKSREQIAVLSKQEPGNELQVANRPAAPSPSSGTMSVTSDAVAVGSLPAGPNARASEATFGPQATDLAAPKQPDERDQKDRKVIAGATLHASAGPNSALGASRLSLFVRWTLSDGKLRRSADGGQTWEAVPFEQDGQFRALSVMGRELWVGGAKGVLYHSADQGTHWSRVVPSAGKVLLTEDVLQLEFSDADHGKLISAVSEWKTNNCGTTWHRKVKN
jgi:hypothetical protein